MADQTDIDLGIVAQGPKGDPGIAPHIDKTTGNWFVGTTDTKIHAQGGVGPAPTLKIGTVTKLAPDAQPTVTLVSSAPGTYILNVGLPQGMKGGQGDKGNSSDDYDKVLTDLKKQVDDDILNGKW